MPSPAAKPRKLTPEEYLAIEREAARKSEFWHGEMFLMSGVTVPHSRIASNIHFTSRLQLRGKDCDVHQAEMKIGVTKRKGFAYPDIAIVCGPGKYFDDVRDVVMNPVVIVEVLSDSTRAFDLSTKLVEYQKLDSLRHYVAVEQDQPIVYHWERREGGRWQYETLEGTQSKLSLAAIQVELPLADIYERVVWPAAPKRRRKPTSQGLRTNTSV